MKKLFVGAEMPLSEFGNHGCGKVAVVTWQGGIEYQGRCHTCDDPARQGASPLNSGAAVSALRRMIKRKN